MAHMSKPALISRFFRIGMSGPTVDGREISADDIDAMANSYDPELYSASINLEHLNFLFPGFSLGKVVALKASDGPDGKRVLSAQIEPTPALLNMNAQKQKLFTSMEIVKNFAKTGKAYLLGLAVTDRPASLGVEALCFAAKNDGPSDDRFKNNLFTPNLEVENFTMADENEAPKTPATPSAKPDESEAPKQTFAEKFKALFSKEEEKSAENFSALEDASLQLAEKFTELETNFNALKKDNAGLVKKVEVQAAEITKLTAALENTPEEGNPRPPATGEDENQTDC